MTDLTDRAMLINLTISMWSARRYDKKASQSVESAFHSGTDSGRYHKKLVTNSQALMKMKLAAESARSFHYTYTLPWATEGSRILSAPGYFTYTNKMKHFKQVFEEGVPELIAEWPTIQVSAQRFLGGLYNEEDYPRVNDLKERFKFSWSVLPVPDAGDFRVHLSDGEIDAIKEQITLETTQATHNAVQEVWQRLYTAVSHMKDRLSNGDAVFRNSLVENVRELCMLLPLLNLTQDVKLDAIGKDILTQLGTHDADDLRDNKALRATVAQRAEALQSQLSAFMGV